VIDSVALPEHLDDLVAVLDVLLLHGLHVLAVQRFFDQQLIERVHSFFNLEKAEKVKQTDQNQRLGEKTKSTKS
jgi:hypothetical protein